METATSLADYTREPLIVPQIRQRDAAGAIQELSQILGREGRVPDAASFCQAVLKRELLANTVVDHEMALPHARLSGLKKLSFALGRSVEAFPWGETGARPVRLVFLLAVPAEDNTNYLPLISGLARLSQDRQQMDKLYSASTAAGIFALLDQIHLRVGRTTAPTRRPGPG